MSCETGCPCCHGACCTDGSCQAGVNCYDCEAEGGEWKGASSTCDPNPCEECQADEDCLFCNQSYDLVDTAQNCAEGFTRTGDSCARTVRVDSCDDCDPEEPGNATDWGSSCYEGYCCDGECQEEECEIGCPCELRGEGHSLAYTDENTGEECCCPPGTTVTEDGECECEAEDPRCTDQGVGWFMPAECEEGYFNCGGACVQGTEEDCPP
jgi:hypothetical protein